MKDDVRYLPVSGTPGLVLGQARLSEFQFDRHYHEDYHIGLVTQGVQRQHFRGQSIPVSYTHLTLPTILLV